MHLLVVYTCAHVLCVVSTMRHGPCPKCVARLSIRRPSP
jgi:hypothetical protein